MNSKALVFVGGGNFLLGEFKYYGLEPDDDPGKMVHRYEQVDGTQLILDGNNCVVMYSSGGKLHPNFGPEVGTTCVPIFFTK